MGQAKQNKTIITPPREKLTNMMMSSDRMNKAKQSVTVHVASKKMSYLNK